MAPENIFFRSCLRGSYNSHATTHPLNREITADIFNTLSTRITTIMGRRHCHKGFSSSTLTSTSCSLSISSPVGRKLSPFRLVRLHCHQIYPEPRANVSSEHRIPRTGAAIVVEPKYSMGMIFWICGDPGSIPMVTVEEPRQEQEYIHHGISSSLNRDRAMATRINTTTNTFTPP